MIILRAFSILFILGGVIGLGASFFPFAYDLTASDRKLFQLVMGLLMGLGLVGLTFTGP